MKAPAFFALCSMLLVAPVFSRADQAPAPRPTPKKEPAKKPEPPAVIEGMTIPRGTGFLGIAIVDSTFRLSFYDAEKKPVAPDVARAALRWPVKYQPGDERAVLNLAPDGNSLTSAFVVRPPYFFKLFITLIAEDAPAGVGETFVVDFRG